jgi:hypothetical protein
MHICVQQIELEDRAIGVLGALPPAIMVDIRIAETGLSPQEDRPRLRAVGLATANRLRLNTHQHGHRRYTRQCTRRRFREKVRGPAAIAIVRLQRLRTQSSHTHGPTRRERPGRCAACCSLGRGSSRGL